MMMDAFDPSSSRSFPEAVRKATQHELSTAETHDTGTAINKSMFWAADMKLTEILATTCGLTSERFASSFNHQPAFTR